jgi:N-methylhydantoinase B
MKAGERFLVETAGGGGYGDARERDRAAVEKDIEEGYVTRDGVARDYGAKG